MGELVIHDIDQNTMRCKDCGMDYGEILSEELAAGLVRWSYEGQFVACSNYTLTFPEGEIMVHPRDRTRRRW